MKTEIVRTWDTIHFHASVGDENSTVELTLNHEQGTYEIVSSGEESVKFKGNNILKLELRLKVVAMAVKYIKEHLKPNI